MKTHWLIFAAVLAMGGSALAAAPSFQGVGDLPGGNTGSYAYAVSADGAVVVGSSYVTTTEREAFRWTRQEGIVGLGRGRGASFANGVSPDGLVIVGETSAGSTYEAFRWTNDSGLVGLGDLPGGDFKSAAYAASQGGGVVVGSGKPPGWSEAFRWTPMGGMEPMGFMPGHDQSCANDISADGTVIVGYSSNSPEEILAFRWTEGTGMVSLGYLNSYSKTSFAKAVSPDGSVVVGYGRNRFGDYESFRWTAAEGMVGLGHLPGLPGQRNEAYGVAPGGSFVVGKAGTGAGDVAFIWDEVNGMRILKEVLENDYGLDLTGWILKEAKAVSDDGLTIVGYGANPLGQAEGWVATLPEPATLGLLAAGVGAVWIKRRQKA